MTIPTANPIPSSAAADLLFNAELLDKILNTASPTYSDRLGVLRMTVAGAIDTLRAINVRGPWVTATDYAVKDVVTYSGVYYICLDPHTSGATFAGESTKWQVYQGEIFTQSVTGGVARKTTDKLKEIVSVEDVLPAGFDTTTTDCSSYVQAALNDRKQVTCQPWKTYIMHGLLAVAGSSLSCLTGHAMINVPAGASLWGCKVEVSDFFSQGIDFYGGDATNFKAGSGTAGTRNGWIIGLPFDTGTNIAGITIRDSHCDGFDGAGLLGREVQYGNTDFGQRVVLDNVRTTRCNIGLHSGPRFEYVQAINCAAYDCWDGIRNQGGNNHYTSCRANYNFRNFALLAGYNDGHGSAVNCDFNHSFGGYGIYAKDIANGFVFVGCQHWFGTLRWENCAGLVFTHGQMASTDIQIASGGKNWIWFNQFVSGVTIAAYSGNVFTRIRYNAVTNSPLSTDLTSSYGDQYMKATAFLTAPSSPVTNSREQLVPNYTTRLWMGQTLSGLQVGQYAVIERVGLVKCTAQVDVTPLVDQIAKIFLCRWDPTGTTKLEEVPRRYFAKTGFTAHTISVDADFFCDAVGQLITVEVESSAISGMTVASPRITIRLLDD